MSVVQYRGDIQSDGSVAPFRVAAKDGIHHEAIRMLQETEGIEIVDDSRESQGMLIRSATKFLQEEHFTQYQHLMYLVRVGVGMDTIDLTKASQSGIATINTPGASTKAVAQRTLALILAWAARVVPATHLLANMHWPKGDSFIEPIDLSEKTLGIVGFGRIGQETRRLAEPHFGAVIFTDVRNIPGKVGFEELLQQADVISLHVSGTEEILTPETLAWLKPDALLVNTARGELVHTPALLDRMDTGLHVAFDVFSHENAAMFEDETIKRLVQHPHFIGTPHTAASDPVTQRNLGKEGADRMIEFAHQGIINPHDIPGHTLPRVLPGLPRRPGIRALLTHRSIPGILATITGIVATSHLNIRELINVEGQYNGGEKLAMTSLDIAEERSSVALELLRRLEKEIHFHRKRLLQYA